MNPYIEILRPGNAIMAVIAILLMAIISGKFTLEVAMASVVVFIVTGAGNSINDYFDHKIDAVNKPERPIPSGRITLKSINLFNHFVYSGNPNCPFNKRSPWKYCLFSSILMIFYARDLKTKCLIGNIAISF